MDLEKILNFLADNYLYFMIGAVVLLFALIGFAVQGRKKKNVDDNPMQPLDQALPNAPTNAQVPNEANVQIMNNTINSNPSPTVTPSPSEPAASTGNEETLTFGPISSEPTETLFTEAPEPVQSNNVEVGTLDLTPKSDEPVMETLDLGAPQMQAQEMPVSMEPEQPAAPVSPTEPVMQVQPQEPTGPTLNNTIQQ